MQVVNALHLGDKDKASTLLLNLQGDDFGCILEYCAKAPDPVFAMETWRIMQEKSVNLNKGCWTLIVQALCKGGYLKEAFNQLTLFEEDDFLCAKLSLYNILLSGCVNSQSLPNVNYCLHLMDKRLTGKSEITYWELLKVAVYQGNLSGVYEIWKNIRNYYNPSLISLRKFILSFTKLGDLQAAHSLLQHMISKSLHEVDHLKVSSSQKFRSSRLDIPIPLLFYFNHDKSDGSCEASKLDYKCGNEVHGHSVINESSILGEGKTVKSIAFDTYKKFLSPEMKRVLRWSFNDLIHAFSQCREYDKTEQLFLQMHELGLEPSPHTYDGFVRAVISEKGVECAMRVVNEMQKRNLNPKNNTLSSISIAYSENLELDMAEYFLAQILSNSFKYIHPFNAFLSACNVVDQPERAIGILQKMKDLNVKPNIRTYELLFQLFGNVNAPYEEGNIFSRVEVKKRVDLLENDMINRGIQHSFVSLEILIRVFGNEGMAAEMLQYFHLAQTLFLHPKSYCRRAMYNNVLHSLVEAKQGRMAVEVFQEMKDSDSPPDSATYNIMIDCCSLRGSFKSACALLSVMLRSGYFPQAITYTTLIKILLSRGDFNSALTLLEQSTSEGFELDVVLFNTVLLAAERKSRIDIVEMIVELMQRWKVKPDPATCGHVFSAYTKTGLHSSAMEALQVLSLRMISEAERALLFEKQHFFEELIHGEDPDINSWIVNAFDRGHESLAVALLSLRWCAIAGHSMSFSSPEESSWARRIASTYGPGFAGQT
ncbi:tetratricopeptide repeat (TPR)-like superfamily protein isoform X2 [Wolffia australiana]